MSATVQTIRPDIERATAATTALNPLAPALDLIEDFAPKVGAPDAPLSQAAQFGEAVDVIDAACTRVGA